MITGRGLTDAMTDAIRQTFIKWNTYVCTQTKQRLGERQQLC